MYKIFVVVMMLVASILTGSVNAYAANTGDVIITEIMYDPASNDAYWEWFEIYNTTAGNISLENWKWSDSGGFGDALTLPAYNLGAGQWAVIYDNVGVEAQEFCDAWVNAGITVDRLIAGGNFNSLNQDGDTVTVWDATDTMIDEVIYVDDLPWPNNNNAASIYLKSDKYNHIDNNDGANWLLSENDVAGAVMSVATGGGVSPHNEGGDIGSPSPGAVPEPSAMMLLIPGLFAVLCLRRIKK